MHYLLFACGSFLVTVFVAYLLGIPMSGTPRVSLVKSPSVFAKEINMSEVTTVSKRVRVKHSVYGWKGDRVLVRADKWHLCKWDNGTETTEHEDDIELESGN